MSRVKLSDIIPKSDNTAPYKVAATLPRTKSVDEKVDSLPPGEAARIRELAIEAAALDDKIKGLTREPAARLQEVKKELIERMLTHELKSVPLPDRSPISLNQQTKTVCTKKALQETLGLQEANNLWERLPQSLTTSVSIPGPPPVDED